MCGSFGDYIKDPKDGAKIRLYDLDEDPSESYNIAAKNLDIVAKIRSRINDFRDKVKSPQDNNQIPAANHKKSGGIWRPWKTESELDIGYEILKKVEL